MYNYWGYGLSISSELEFPELFPFAFENPDVTIRIGKTPQTLEGADVVHKVNVSITPTEYLFKLLNIANYYAGNGNTVIVEPMPGTDGESVRLFLLSNVMAAILHQRNIISLHASAIEYGDGVALFCGTSGAGKSTTVTMLQQTGYKVFSDDVCVLKANGDVVTAVPSYPMMKLWEDSFEKIGIAPAGNQHKIRPQLPKYGRFFHENFNIKARPVKKVFILDCNITASEACIVAMRSVNAFRELQKNTYRPVQMNAMKKRESHFAVVSKLTAAAEVYKIIRPPVINTLEQVIELVNKVLKEND